VIVEGLVVLVRDHRHISRRGQAKVVDIEMPREAGSERLEIREDLRFVPHDVVLVDLNRTRVEQPVPRGRIARSNRVEQRLRIVPELGLDGRLRGRPRAAGGEEQRAKRLSPAAAP